MGLQETSRFGFPDAAASNPMELDLCNSWRNNSLYVQGLTRINFLRGRLKKLKKRYNIQSRRYKLYPGYYNFSVNDPIYEPVYALAAYYNIPVVMHSGDTYSDRGLLKYSHPWQLMS